MGSIHNKSRLFGGAPPHHNSPCTRAHQIGALAVVLITFFFTRLFDQSSLSSSCPNSFNVHQSYNSRDDVVRFPDGDGSIVWPHRGYGSHLSLNIYVYDEREIDGLKELMYGRDGKISPESCLKGQWGTQVKIHKILLQSRFRTRKKEEADLFFVPAYAKCVRIMGGLNDKEINQTYVKVLSQMPYFRSSGGRNHIFVFPSGAGAHLFKSWATFLNRSIILTPEGDRTDKRDTSAFNTWKDIIIPGNVDDGMITHGRRLVEPVPLPKRKYLANFLGRAQGKVGRLQLIELAKKFPEKLESPVLKFSGPDKLGRKDYFEHLRNAKFCLAPRGESSWTLRFYESFFVECVPVILSDQAELPFQNVVDYTQISIKWPASQTGPQLLDYLESIPDGQIEKMIANGRKVRCLWAYAPDSEPCSAFNGIMWELQRKEMHIIIRFLTNVLQVDDKYQFSCENKDLMVHGWISTEDPVVGFWQITPSSEFRTGGPVKQNLTSHVGPTTLAMFISAHYAGSDLVVKFGEGEVWKKVYGPVFMYLNSAFDGEDPLTLWDDAKNQMLVEVQSWPYSFPASKDFQSSDQRGSVCGRLLVLDRYISQDNIIGKGSYVGLAPPGKVGSWQRECKDYQFWTQADDEGYFSINNIRTGEYNLYAWVPGFLGDYRNDTHITITSGCEIDMGNLVYEPPRDGPTLWEIGIPDRSAAEFYVPDPSPKYTDNFLINPPNKFRQYGLWERYAEQYPDGDLTYTIGQSDYTKDWFYAHVTRKIDDITYAKTTWTIKFNIENVDKSKTYKLRLALASAHQAELQVRINDPSKDPPLFSSGKIGGDNAIARHGIHGLYWTYTVDVPGDALFMDETNAIYLTQANGGSPFTGIMYDYIRLEGPMQR